MRNDSLGDIPLHPKNLKKIYKHDLFELMDKYLSGDINCLMFCDKYHERYTLKINLEDLSKEEVELFDESLGISNRMAISDEEYKKYPGVYFCESDLKRKILEVKSMLQ